CGAPQPTTNLLVISIDTTRADRIGVYGHADAETPNIDALAAEGFRFERHMTPVPITLPAHTSLFTGLYPPTHGVRDNGTFFADPSLVTLAEVLRDAGYATAGFIGAFPMVAQFGLDQGFDHYDDDVSSERGPGVGRPSRADIYFDERPAGAVIDATIAHLETLPDDRPFFVFVHVFDPHQPLLPPAPYDVRFRDQPYDGEIAYVDAQLGRLFDAVQARGAWDDTVVVVTADHGEGLGEHGELTHGLLLHQATLHIPLILHGPDVPVGTSRAWSAAPQVFATLTDLLGVRDVPEAERPRGDSLVPRMRNGGEPPAGSPRFTAYFETIAPRTSQGWSQLTGWMKEDWRLIHAPKPELYDLDVDPREEDNQFAGQANIAATLRRELGGFLAAQETRAVADNVSTADAETVERLAALGYLQADPDALQGLDDMLQVEGLLNPRDLIIDVSLFSEAKAAMAAQQWPLARSLWRQVLRRSPNNVNAYRGLALIEGYAENWQGALAELDRGLALQPDAADLLRLKGEIFVERGRPREGIDILTALPTDSIEACTWIGVAYGDLGQAEEARLWYTRGLEIEPDSVWLRLYLANSLAGDGQYDRAETLYRDLIGDRPYFALAYYNYGRLMIDRGAPERARPLLARAADLHPHHAPTRAALQQLDRAPAGSTP
ncbi:MAG: sulfatase-like hydrolase/transferase, partial [Acidobacteriota bacterium]